MKEEESISLCCQSEINLPYMLNNTPITVFECYHKDLDSVPDSCFFWLGCLGNRGQLCSRWEWDD